MFNKIDDATTPGTKIENTPAGVKHWHTKALDYIINLAQNKLFREFRTRFGDITTSDGYKQPALVDALLTGFNRYVNVGDNTKLIERFDVVILKTV